MIDYSELEEFVRRRVPEHLYMHCAATGLMALDLAAHHGLDTQKARAAGLLHDIARSLDDAKLIDKAQRFGLEVSDLERTAPVLLHGAVGARTAEIELGIADPDILEAIKVHTTGAPGMGAIARVVFVADYAEPTRAMPGAREVRSILPEHLDEAALIVVKRKIEYVMQSGAVVEPRCLELQDELLHKTGRARKRP